jgi:citrate lyase subunit beta/citryl-CoA lyase
MSLPPLRSWLYAPGNNAKLLERVFTAGADAVILDLEDAVPPAEKARARAMVADFLRDVGGAMTEDALETLYARSQLVLAARLSGIRSPVEGVYTRLDDDAGLEHTTRQSRAVGFFGRSALHPRQVPIINAVFTPSEAEVAWANMVMDAASRAEASGSSALRLPNGDFVDVAIVRRAEATLRLAQSLGDRQ